jgi:hypothetical protein
MPPVAIYSMQFKPGDPDTLMAATFGRGIYTAKLSDVVTGCAVAVPYARFNRKDVRRARHGQAGSKLRLRGTARVRKGCGRIKSVSVSVARKAGKKRCRYLKRNGSFSKKVSCKRPAYIKARGTTKWRFTSKRALRRGTYTLRVRSIDSRKKRSPVSKRRHTRVTIRLR